MYVKAKSLCRLEDQRFIKNFPLLRIDEPVYILQYLNHLKNLLWVCYRLLCLFMSLSIITFNCKKSDKRHKNCMVIASKLKLF